MSIKPMYENMDYRRILERMLARIPSSLDKREGSVIMNALAPAAAEIGLAYQELDKVIAESYASTQSRGFLLLRAAERGIYPKPATHAQRRAEFSTEVPVGARFAAGEMIFVVTERLEDGGYRLLAETAGSAGNVTGVLLTPVDYMDGLEKAVLTDILSPGEEEESTESLRLRYFNNIDAQPFGGNISDYREKAMQMAGVGGAKVLPLWNGPGTVKVLLISSQYTTPSADLVNGVQEALDPTGDGKGLGLAPIGHVCTVGGVSGVIVNIGTTLTLREDCDEAQARASVEAAADRYFAELSAGWSGTSTLVVRISQLETRVLEIPGILDVMNTTLNGVAANLQLLPEQIPVRGNVDAAFA